MNRKIVHSVFEKIADTYPDNVAIEEGAQKISYAELDRQANGMANALRQKGMEKDTIAGILLPAGIDYVTAVLGVSKAGGVFMPLDVEYPGKRLEHILEKTSPEFIISNSHLKETVTGKLTRFNRLQETTAIFVMDGKEGFHVMGPENGDLGSLAQEYREERPPLVSAPDDSHYIIHTSGSTGEPKAILGCHKGLSHFIHWEITEFGLDHTARVSLLAPTTFDVSLRDIFLPLLSGGTLCIPHKGLGANLKKLLQWMEDARLTLVHCVPSLFRLITKEIESRGNTAPLPHLKQLLLAGEALYGSDVTKWMDMVGDRIELVNLYGPSETTLAKVFNRIKERPEKANVIIPIGQPISNTAILILKNGTLCRIGEIGEICIKTPFRTKGYYKDPEATANSFVQNPLTDKEDVIYKTGDLGRYFPDRSIEFVGRLDRQVKISGVRIELQEVETVLRGFEAIDQTVVSVHKTQGHEHRLVCYYTEKEPVETGALRAYLDDYLPSYMVPSFFVRLDGFKLNINGKIDKKALPKPEALVYENIEYEPPANRTEAELAAIWKEVLGLKKVGVKNPFFEIGGNSLLAIRIISRIYKVFGKEISIKDFFDHGTIRKLSALVGRSEQSMYKEIPPAKAQAYYDLSHAQRRLWIMDRIEGGGIAYNIPGAYLIEGKIDVALFQKSFEAVIERHESLRTTFVTINGEPKQKIHDHMPLALREVDLTGAPDPEKVARQQAKKEASKTFDLSKGPLFTAAFLKLADRRHVFLMNMHHIISDAWSLDVLAKEVLTLYEAYSKGEPSPLQPLRIQYKDYAAWQNELLASEAVKEHGAYWHDRLSGDIPVLNLAADYPRPAVRTFNGSQYHFLLDDASATALMEFSQEHEASLFMVLLAALKILLYRYTGQEDMITGSPMAGRGHGDLENQVGFYVNMLALRDQITGHETFQSVLEKVKKTTAEAYDHQVYPFDRLVDELDIHRDMSHSPLFDVAMTLHEEQGIEKSLKETALKIAEFPTDWDTSKFDLVFLFIQHDDRLRFDISYNTDLFKTSTIERLGTHFKHLVKQIPQNPSQLVQDLSILGASETRLLLEDFNNTAFSYPDQKSIVDIFESQVEKGPDRPAVICEDRCLTYKELHGRANELARLLRAEYGVRPEELVGVQMDRSEWSVVGFMGILKSGAAYLPIDPAYPQDRIDYILKDSRCRILLTEEKYLKASWPPSVTHVLDLPREIGAKERPLPPVEARPGPGDLAYVIYTSGSTGKPKGVMIEHRGPVNMSLDQIRSFGVSREDHVLQFASPSFDASIYEMCMGLFSGAAVVVARKERVNNAQAFTDYLCEKRVTVVTLPPVYLNTLDRESLKTVKTIITAGEPAILDDALFYAGDKQYINAYGPTETSVCASFHRVRPDYPYGSNIPIGKPISNTSIFILDHALNPVPMGVSGEMCVSGVGLARGYLNRPELTKERFIPHPFHKGKRLYRTGDVARWLPDGNIEFEGRNDDQVKVRGHRIELGEIENTLKKHGDIGEALVVTNKAGTETRLVAYFTLTTSGAEPPSSDLSPTGLRRVLSRDLPDYMIPSHFVKLERFPTTPNGKIDRKALPDPQDLKSESDYAAPRNETERKLAHVWEVVIGKKPGIHDDYFSLGGDSIKAIQVVSRLHHDGLKLDVVDIYQHPTISELAPKVGAVDRVIEQETVSGRVPLTAIQSWFFENFKGHTNHFNQSVILSSRQGFDPEALKIVFQAIQDHHDALRMTYQSNGHQPIQEIAGLDYPLGFDVVDLRKTKESPSHLETRLRDIQEGFRLDQGPVMKALLFRLQQGDRLFIAIHHLVVDTVSWRILLEDFISSYKHVLAGQPVALPPKTDSFKYWAEQVQLSAGTDSLLQETAHWTAVASSATTTLPTDFESSVNLVEESRLARFRLSAEETKDLLTQVHHAYNTAVNDFLLCALARTVRLWHGGNQTLIALEGHGRESLAGTTKDMNLGRTVGWFTSLYPMALTLPDSDDPGSQIKHVKETLRKVPNHGIGYGLLAYVMGQGTTTGAALRQTFCCNPQVSFNYLGQFDQDIGTDLFEISHEATPYDVSPAAPRLHDLDINVMVLHGQLEVSISYSKKQFKHQTITAILNDFREELLLLISHAKSRDMSELTPADLTYDSLSIEELEGIFAGA
ncbi:MAG: amino acid adenylation domain-containing protein [Thermodesulfobacteriota bacterium]|nr:amino acid adenylation domain-containing protein [Thermodesulfobacteriota bacterium]